MTIDHLVTLTVTPELNGYSRDRAILLYERLEDALATQPGITSVTGSFVAAVAGDNRGKRVRVDGTQAAASLGGSAQYNEIGSAYFSTMGIPVLAGREIARTDARGTPRVAVVNEAFARQFGLGAQPVGARLSWCCTRDRRELDAEIVGLVRDARYSSVKADVPPLFYVPYRQTEDQGIPSIYLRTALDLRQVTDIVRRIVAQLDAELPVGQIRTMEQQVQENVFLDRFISLLSTAFAMLTTLVGAIGVYGVLAYTLAQRMREIGLRMALGATPRHVRRLVVRQVAWMTAVGATLGLVGAVAAGRTAQALLFGVDGHDPMVLASAAVALTVVAFAAAALPAYRASRVDPMRALRAE